MADLTNIEIMNILRSYGKECGPITPQTKNIYLKQIERLQKNGTDKISMKSTRRFEVANKDKLSFRNLTDHSDCEIDKPMNYYRRKDVMSTPISPMAYDRGNHTNTYNEQYAAVSPQGNSSNVGERWYKGSLRALSSCLGSRDSGLMDISDGDLSDTEGNLFTRLRKNYFKKTVCQDSMPLRRSLLGQDHSTDSSIYSSNLPNILLIISIVLILCLFGTYLTFKNRYSHSELGIAMDRLLCQSSQGSYCLLETELKILKPYLYRLYEVMCDYSGRRICEGNDDCRMSFQMAKEYLNHGLKKNGDTPISDYDWSRLMMLMISLPSNLLNIIGYDNENVVLDESRLPEDVTFLECLRPKIPLLCQIKLKLLTMLSWLSYMIIYVFLLGVLLLICYGLYLYRRRQKEANNRTVNKLREVLSNISDILQEQLHHSESNSKIEAFLPLEKIRIMLQQSYPELRDNQLWEKVKDYTFRNEPCIQMRETLVNGTILQWRGRPGWQGSAVHSGKEVSFERGPTECLKIRNLTVDKYNSKWEEYLRKELTSRLQDSGRIRHIGFIMKGSKVIGYVMCGSREVAGAAFNKINANYFSGNLLNVKFIRVDKYLERFPGAQDLLK